MLHCWLLLIPASEVGTVYVSVYDNNTVFFQHSKCYCFQMVRTCLIRPRPSQGMYRRQ